MPFVSENVSFLRRGSIIPAAVATAAAAGALMPLEASAAAVDLTSLTTAVDFSTTTTAILAVSAALIVVYIAIKAAKFVLGMVRTG